MPIIWKGWGWIVLPLVLIIVSFVELSGYLIAANGVQFSKALGIGLFLSALVMWLLGRYLHYGEKPFFMQSKERTEIALRGEHSLYLIPVEYWAFVLIFLGLLALTN